MSAEFKPERLKVRHVLCQQQRQSLEFEPLDDHLLLQRSSLKQHEHYLDRWPKVRQLLHRFQHRRLPLSSLGRQQVEVSRQVVYLLLPLKF